MAYWILQANPDEIYQVFDALANPTAIRTWRVARYRQQIAPGDEFALWASGRNSGVYGFGVVTEPAELRPPDADSHWLDPAEAKRPAWQVGISVEDVLDNPIPRKDLARDSRFANAAIIRMAGGGNPFPVTAAEWRALRAHLPPASQPERPGRNPPWSRDE